MIRTNYIHLNQHDWNKPIYRFIMIDWLVDLFVQRQNALIAPHKWDDPFENILERVLYCRKSDGKRFMLPCVIAHMDNAGRCVLTTIRHGAAIFPIKMGFNLPRQSENYT
jgi:hypothetical protein